MGQSISFITECITFLVPSTLPHYPSTPLSHYLLMPIPPYPSTSRPLYPHTPSLYDSRACLQVSAPVPLDGTAPAGSYSGDFATLCLPRRCNGSDTHRVSPGHRRYSRGL